MGFVYLILEVNQHGEESHKIGFSKNNPKHRLKNLQTGNPNKIELLKFYESVNYKIIEKWLHSRFSNKRTISENEWFRLSDEDVISFINTCENIDSTIKLLIEQNHFYLKYR
jgi:hypothetical protein